MRKQAASVLLCLVVLCSCLCPAYAQEQADVTISSVSELLEFAENCRLDSYSRGLTVSLTADLDLSGAEFESIPYFAGTFLGNGHTIKGLKLTAAGSVQGLFRYVAKGAVVEQLQVQGNVQPTGSHHRVGGIAGSNSGVIRHCTFTGTVAGGDNVGGIAGENTVSGIIEDCCVSGEVGGIHFTGGIAGSNSGVIRRCVNDAAINTTPQQNSVELSDITIDSLTNAEAVNAATDLGGIAGESRGVIRESKNNGSIGYRHMGYNVGGIAGTQSGYLVDCENTAPVQGRKDVGGIVGQLEPAAVLDYDADTLQILQGQLSEVSASAGKAAGTAQKGAEELREPLSQLEEQAGTAQDALDVLLSDEPVDPDTREAARNALSDSVQDMTGTAEDVFAATQGTSELLSGDLEKVAAQLEAMGATLGSGSAYLGVRFEDVSDHDTADDLEGKVERCSNRAAVQGDLSAGGIVGAMAPENDLDAGDDWKTQESSSMNVTGELRAVVLQCENSGAVSAGKQYAGGIVGSQLLGLVKKAVNTGALTAEGADYVGGIAGASYGSIRTSYARCAVSGDTCVGGIAGVGAALSDCRSMVDMQTGTEKLGAILGVEGAYTTAQESGIRGNYYLAISKDRGGVDGISYDGAAQPLALDAFLALEQLPELFGTVTVRFVQPGGKEKTVSLPVGSALAEDQIPAVEQKDGHAGYWDGLSVEELQKVYFDQSFTATYDTRETVIESAEKSADRRAILLVQGSFPPEAEVTLQPLQEEAPVLKEGQSLLEAWHITVSHAEGVENGRYLIPEEYTAEEVQVWLLRDGAWQRTQSHVNGSYVVFSMNADESVALIYQASHDWLWIAVGALALLGLAALWQGYRQRKK